MQTIYEFVLGFSIALILLGGFVLLYLGGLFTSTHWRSAMEGIRRAITYLRVPEQEEVAEESPQEKKKTPPKVGPHGWPMTPNGRREMTAYEVILMRANKPLPPPIPQRRPYGPVETLIDALRFWNPIKYMVRTKGMNPRTGQMDMNRLAYRRPDWDTDDMSVDSQAPMNYGYHPWG